MQCLEESKSWITTILFFHEQGHTRKGNFFFKVSYMSKDSVLEFCSLQIVPKVIVYLVSIIY